MFLLVICLWKINVIIIIIIIITYLVIVLIIGKLHSKLGLGPQMHICFLNRGQYILCYLRFSISLRNREGKVSSSCIESLLKGTVPRDFRFQFFACIAFPPNTHEYTIFLKILGDICSSRCSFNQKGFNNFFGTSLSIRVNILINLFLQVHCKVSTV
jgi:hypothetical protein